MCIGILNGTLPSAVSDTSATSSAFIKEDPSIPTGRISSAVFHLPNGAVAPATTVNKLLHNFMHPPGMSTLSLHWLKTHSSAPANSPTQSTQPSMMRMSKFLRRKNHQNNNLGGSGAQRMALPPHKLHPYAHPLHMKVVKHLVCV